MTPKVSVILTSYNRPRLLVEAVNSVLAQTFQDWELIIVDDCSSRVEVKDYLANIEDPRIIVVSTCLKDENRAKKCRYAVCINLGLRLSQGKYITYLTDDDLYLPTRLSVMSSFLDNAGSGCNIVYSEQEVVTWVGGRWQFQFYRKTKGTTREVLCHVDHCQFMHRKTCLLLLDEPYWPEGPEHWIAGDAGFFAKLVQHFDFYPVPASLSIHRLHPDNVQLRLGRGSSPIYEEEY